MNRKDMDWQQVRDTLRTSGSGAGPRAAADFWADFKARAKLVPQLDEAAVPSRASHAMLWWRSSLAAAAAVLAVVALYSPLHRTPTDNDIQALEIVASHTGIIIMSDSTVKGTIVWITGMAPEARQGG